MKKLFFDAEFCDITAKEIKFLSLALVKETGEKLYIEIKQPFYKCSGWVMETVVPLLKKEKVSLDTAREQVREFIGDQAQGYQLVADVNQFDWVGWCAFWGCVFQQPVHYIPLDLSTIIDDRGYDVDIDRNDLAESLGIEPATNKHNALDDALLTMRIWYALQKQTRTK